MTASSAERLDPAIWRLVVVVLLGPMMTHMDSTVVNIALPALRQTLHAPFESVQWVVSGYLLALALALPVNAWLVHRIGVRRLYLACFSAFTLASLACGTARTIDELIVARMFQGISGGLLTPMTQMMIARAAGRHMARVIGYVAVPVLVAPVIGPVLAGAILSHAGWPWLFYINVPIGVVAVVSAVFLLPKDEAEPERRPFDLAGFLLICPGLVCVLYGLDHLPRTGGVAALVLGVLFGAGFVLHARRHGDAALVDLRLFDNATFATATTTQFLANGATFVGQMLLPLFLIAGCGFPAATAGWMLAPMGIGMLCVYPSMGFLTDRFGCRAVSACGALLVILSTLPVLWMTWNPVIPTVLAVALFARGVGQSAIGAPSLAAAYGSVPRAQIPLAGTALNIVQRLGGPTATTMIALVISVTITPGSGRSDFALAFVAMIALQLLLFVSASRLPVRIPV